ncbi:MAG: hypothetical protein GY795_49440 [Desulfobacterales bacterium]|nr:hypothetical protein [Desulfobacterales bacterium]
MKPKNIVMLVILVITIGLSAAMSNYIFETVNKGSYHIKQTAVTGTISAIMKPGLYLQLGDIQVWPKAQTFFFTADKAEGEDHDQSIEVRFNDGSMCNISGTLRIVLPVTKKQAIALATEHGYESYTDLESKLILPVVRNSLRLTSNLMSARESYSEKRSDFIFWAWDQVQNGTYETTEEDRKVKDPVSGEMVSRTFKILKRDATGKPLYQRNPLEGLGLKLANFEIKSFVYAKKVSMQIATQQEALMAVETARAKAKEAEQRALTAEAEGKAKVMQAKYEEEQKKVRALVAANKSKEVAELGAQRDKRVAELGAQRDKGVAELGAKKELEVAKLRKQAAEYEKERQILLGEGEARRKKLVMQADGALQQKLDTYENVMATFAKEFSKQKWVPEMMIANGNNGKSANDALAFINLLTAKTMKDLNLDMNVPQNSGMVK